MEPVRKKFRTRLENLQKELTRKGDLDGALAVKAELIEEPVAPNATQRG